MFISVFQYIVAALFAVVIFLLGKTIYQTQKLDNEMVEN